MPWGSLSPSFSHLLSVSSLTPTASFLSGTVLVSLFIFHVTFTPLVSSLSLPLPQGNVDWRVGKVDLHGYTEGKNDVNIGNPHRWNCTETMMTFLWLHLWYITCDDPSTKQIAILLNSYTVYDRILVYTNFLVAQFNSVDTVICHSDPGWQLVP